MKRMLLLFLFFIPLTGCMTTALITTAAVGGTVLYDKRGFKTILRDRHITQTAQNLIDATPSLEGRSHISIATFNGTTLLVGQAQSEALKQEAGQLISHVPDIKKLFNEITVAGATSSLQHTNDTWLTTKVRTSLLTKQDLSSSQIKVVTENSVVYLMGDVSQNQASLAVNTTRRVPGVTKVVKVFQRIS